MVIGFEKYKKWTKAGIHLKYVDADKMKGYVGKSELTQRNGL